MIQFNSKYTGQYYSLQGGEVYSRTAPGVFKYAGAATNATMTVQLTGYMELSAIGNSMYQTVGGGWINLSHGWQYQAYAPIRMYSAKDAQYYVNKVIKANASILENNLLCARFSDKLTNEEKVQLRTLQNRLDARNNQLLNDGLCNDLKVSSPPGYASWSGYLQSFMNSNAGIGSATATIVVVAIVVASLATAAYFAYKYMASEAEKDVQYSNELTKVLLNKLTPEEYEQLMQETQGIVTKSKLKQKFSGVLSFLKWGLVGAAGYFIYQAYNTHKKKGSNNGNN